MRADNSVRKGSEDLKLGVNNDDATHALLGTLSNESGSLSMKFEFGGGSAMEMQTKLIDGELDGPLRTFLWNGKDVKLQSVISYTRGEKDGAFVTYDPNEKILWEGSWQNGQRSGKWLLRYRDQSLAIESTFLNDRLHGEVVVLDVFGAEVVRGVYVDGKPVSGSFVEEPWGLFAAALVQPYTPEFIAVKKMIYDGGALKSTQGIDVKIQK
jgi:antitoxin component YwqK of YwqJK toxin-antitoxin module